ncbi:hypothetical protein JKF63_05923 [Porcisia hertigi]|uniref:Cytidyltransferase-like domain-containing protein n=1 Tax=Porcisia hertigi TaxID=2761500 RepID=A0A836LFJ1_9TRYP|nr:hypothetical protein JKF63_05923 [Porcisia hertigi]
MPIELLVEAIHASPIRLSLCICGAGAGVIRCLTRVPECSRTLLEADTLYHRGSAQAALDGLPRKIVSADTARQLAQHAFHMSRTIVSAEVHDLPQPWQQPTPAQPKESLNFLFGIGATSAIKTHRPRHGKDEAYVCVWGGLVGVPGGVHQPSGNSSSSFSMEGQVRDYHLVLPDCLSRAEQDEQVELMVLHAILRTVESCIPADAEALSKGTDAAGRRIYPRSLFQALLPRVGGQSISRSTSANTSSLLPGLSVTADSMRLCSMPSESPPVPVCVDPSDEVRFAVQSVLRASASVADTGGIAQDVCALWNRHGELRCRGIPPYSEDVCIATEPVMDHRQRCGHDRGLPYSGSGNVIRLLYPGSFNPLHYGHTELVQAAIRLLLQRQQEVMGQTALPVSVELTYEIAVKVVDKGATEVDDLVRRVQQFLRRGERVAVTMASLFVTKAQLFPGHGFLIGIDTATRVLNPQHYSASKDPAEAEAAMVTALTRDIAGRGCYFVVGGRKMSDAAGWQDFSTLRIPGGLEHLFMGIPPTDFRIDISSTELRAQRMKAHP